MNFHRTEHWPVGLCILCCAVAPMLCIVFALANTKHTQLHFYHFCPSKRSSSVSKHVEQSPSSKSRVRMSAWSEWSKESKTVEGGQTREWFNCLVQSSDVMHETGSHLNLCGLLLRGNPFHTFQVVM